MKNTYQKIKQTARKHVFPAVIAGTLAYSTTSCKEDLSYLPLDQKFQTELVTKNKRTIDSLIQLGNENAKNAKTKAIEMSKDNRVSIKEMEGVLSKYNVPCLGCPMAQMEMNSLTLGQICGNYGIDLKKLLEELNKI